MSVDEIPMIPKVGKLTIHSGNIVNWNRLKRKPNQTPNQELAECIEATLTSRLSTSDKNELQYLDELDCKNDKFMEKLPSDERRDLKLTVKLFLCTLSLPPETLIKAIDKVQAELDTNFIESVLLGFPEFDDDDDEERILKVIQPYWKVLEELVRKDTIWAIGIADLNKSLLEKLCNWAEVKPIVNQVNLAGCCEMPEDLKEYAKEQDIQLLIHNDPRDILTSTTLNSIISSCCTEKDGDGWEPKWLLRYSVVIKCRGIIKTKGYVVKATRDIKRKKHMCIDSQNLMDHY